MAQVIPARPLGKKPQPTLLLGDDRVIPKVLGGELAEFQHRDAAVVEETPALLVAHPEAVGIARACGPQVLAEQPDGVGGLRLPVILARRKLGAATGCRKGV